MNGSELPVKPRHTLLISLAVGMALVDRVDLVAGRAAVSVTPFIALSPFLIIASLTLPRDLQKLARKNLTQNSAAATWAAAGLMAAASASLVFAPGGRGVQRLALLALLITACWSLGKLVRATRNVKALRLGACIGLALYVVFDLLQLHWQRAGSPIGVDWHGIIDIGLSPYGQNVIRYTGAASDPNRAAMAIAFYTYLLLADPLTSRRLRPLVEYGLLATGTLLAALTLSRSGIAAFVLVMFASIAGILQRRRTMIGHWAVISVLVAAAAWLSTGAIASLFGGASTLEGRATLRDGSSQSHFLLIRRGIELGTHGWQALTGHGYGQSYLYVQDIFAGDPYGNFHSLFITTLVETGVIGFGCVLVLLVAPLWSPRRTLALGLIAFNIFYQSLSDPIFWVIMATLWLFPDRSNLRESSESTERTSTSNAHTNLATMKRAGA